MVLVTGATGILGRVILLDLLKSGQQVRATKRKSSNIDEVKKSFRFYTDHAEELFNKIEWYDVDFDDLESIKKVLFNVQEVYHCAAIVSFQDDERRQMYHTNIGGTRNLLYACENSSVNKFCFISSTAVLDGVNENGEMDENSDFNPKFDHSPYSRSKHFSEMEVWRASAEGLSAVILNPGVILGSGNWESSSGKLFKSFANFPYASSGNSAYVDVRDVAEIAISLMKNNVFGERFIVIAENKKFSDIIGFVRQKLGKSKPKIISNAVLTFGYSLNVFFGWLFPPLRLLNKVNIKTVTSDNFVSNMKVKKELEYHFIPIEESLDFHLNKYISDHQITKKNS
jgi:dihydroflavonol-4-reductase